MIESYKIDAVAIGNGTASRETENFVTHQQFDRPVQVFVVSEQGASIYSASKTARDEFPDYDVTVRGGRLHRSPADGSAGGTGQDRS